MKAVSCQWQSFVTLYAYLPNNLYNFNSCKLLINSLWQVTKPQRLSRCYQLPANMLDANKYCHIFNTYLLHNGTYPHASIHMYIPIGMSLIRCLNDIISVSICVCACWHLSFQHIYYDKLAQRALLVLTHPPQFTTYQAMLTSVNRRPTTIRLCNGVN